MCTSYLLEEILSQFGEGFEIMTPCSPWKFKLQSHKYTYITCTCLQVNKLIWLATFYYLGESRIARGVVGSANHTTLLYLYSAVHVLISIVDGWLSLL